MDSARLAALLEHYQTEAAESPDLFLDSITVIRNGYIVAEAYPNPRYPPETLHIIHSSVKSIISTLVGIAVDQGHLESVDVPLVEVFADRTIANVDDRKRRMTIRDLLSMESGLHARDSYLYRYEGLFAMQHTEDWLQYALDLPMSAEPGERLRLQQHRHLPAICRDRGNDGYGYAGIRAAIPVRSPGYRSGSLGVERRGIAHCVGAHVAQTERSGQDRAVVSAAGRMER